MNKPHIHMNLVETNYWRNLKAKAKNPKDEKEQAAINLELMNCIDLLEKRIISLENRLSETQEEMSRIVDGIGKNTDILHSAVAHINAIEDTVGREKVREVFEKKGSFSEKTENSVEDESTKNEEN